MFKNIMKKVIFIHWYAPKEMCEKLEALNVIWWYWWLQEKLKEKWYKVFNPLVKNLWEWNYDNWKKEFEKLDYDEDTIIVAHSAGVAFIVRFLWEINKKINKLILVAPAKIIWEDKTLEKFYDFEINNNLKNNIKKVKIFVSQDDEERHNKSALIYKEKLNWDLQIFKNKGHFILEKFEEILKEF
jgi:predicted alpha/beta hydrolase family esterase